MVDWLVLYENLIRILLVALAVLHLRTREYNKLIVAVIVLALTFVPWLLGLIPIALNRLSLFLYPAVFVMACYLGTGWKLYDRFPWWDRAVHFLSGVLFFSVGISLAQRVPSVGVTGTLVFSAALSLAMHMIWEVLEYLADNATRGDNQRWQKRNQDIIHDPQKTKQPAGLVDTMHDMIACIVGTAVACVGWWIAL